MLNPIKSLNKVAIVSMVFSALLLGCTNSKEIRPKDPDKQHMSVRETPVTKELACMGDMLTTYRNSQYKNKSKNYGFHIKTAVGTVLDKTDVSKKTYGDSEIPSDMTDMAIAAVSKIGGPIRLTTSPDKIDAGTIVIFGSLTEFDRSLQNSKTGLDGNVDYMSSKTRQNTGTTGQNIYEDRPENSGGISASYNNLNNVSRMTMDFRIVRMYDNGNVNTASVVTNTILLYQNAETKSFGVNLNGKSLGMLSTFGATGGLGYTDSMTEVDARHAAIRMLVEHSVMEILGKEYKLPYWRCNTKVNKDEEGNILSIETNPNEKYYTLDKDDKGKYKDMDIDIDPTIIINLVKRYYKKEDYNDSHNGISFIDRPASGQKITISDEQLKKFKGILKENGETLETPDSIVLKKKKSFKVVSKPILRLKEESIATKWKRELIAGNVYAPIKAEWWKEELKKRESDGTSLNARKAWVKGIKPVVSAKPDEFGCDGKIYLEKATTNVAVPTEAQEDPTLNPNLYADIDSKDCLLSKVIPAYLGCEGRLSIPAIFENRQEEKLTQEVLNKMPECLLLNEAAKKGNSISRYAEIKHKTTVKKEPYADAFAEFWINIPVKKDARWEH